MAAITDKFNKAANGTGVYPSVASVTAIREQGGSILSCDDLAGWATDTAVHFSTYRLMADGTVDTTTQSDWKGIVSGNTITQITHLAGNNDNGHLVGDKVELNPTISWLDDLITGILKSHNQDGTLKDNIIQAKHIVNGAINNTKLAAKAVKSENVDFETIPSYVYSLTEKVIGKWVDGNTIYRKVVAIGTLPNKGTKNVLHGITHLNVVLNAYGHAVTATGTTTPIPMAYTNAIYSVSLVEVTQTNIVINTADNKSNFGNGYIVLEYTKTQ